MNKRDLILHPVRMRILAQLAGRQVTTAQIAAALPDVPQATLYRQIKILVDGGVLTVVGERTAHGAVERTLAMAQDGGRLAAHDFANLTVEDHLRYFGIFATTLIDAFGAYLQHADLTRLLEDGLSYNHIMLHLTDAEREMLRATFMSAVQAVIGNPPSADRRPYTLASVVIPGK